MSMALLILASPLVALAQSESPADSELDGSTWVSKGFDYAMCAFSIATIETGVGVAFAVLTCGKALNTWWTE